METINTESILQGKVGAHCTPAKTDEQKAAESCKCADTLHYEAVLVSSCVWKQTLSVL